MNSIYGERSESIDYVYELMRAQDHPGEGPALTIDDVYRLICPGTFFWGIPTPSASFIAASMGGVYQPPTLPSQKKWLFREKGNTWTPNVEQVEAPNRDEAKARVLRTTLGADWVNDAEVWTLNDKDEWVEVK